MNLLKPVKNFLAPALFFIFFSASSQETWGLQKCLDYAVENNIQIQQGLLSVGLDELYIQRNKYDFTPNLNANVDYGTNFGKNVDPTTYRFVNQTTHTNQYGISISQDLLPFQQIKNLSKSRIDLDAIKLDQDVLKSNIQLNILTAYLNILNAEEQLGQAKEQKGTTQQQYDHTATLIKAGALAEKSLVDIEAQMAGDDAFITSAENARDLAYLSLKQILQLEPGKDFVIERPNMPDDPEFYQMPTAEEVYAVAIQTRPEVKSAALKIESAKIQIDIAKTSYYPSLSFYTSANSNWSSQYRNYVLNPDDPLNPLALKVKYGTQLKDNIGYSIGLRLSIPIYNKRLPYFSMKQADFAVKNAELDKSSTEIQLYDNIRQAHLKAVTAQKNFTSSKKSLEAAEKSYAFAKERLDNGAISILEFNVAKNNVDITRSKVTQAKYEYIFNTKVLDYYLGKDLKLE